MTFTPDAYYYFTIAKNFANGNSITFDNYNITTGFHPLWFFILSIIFKITNSTETFLYVVYLVQTILFLLGYYFLYIFSNRVNISSTIFIILTIPIFLININVFLSGVENSLQFFLLSCFMMLFLKNNNDIISREILISVCLILLYFTRLDSIFLLVIYCIYFLNKTYNEKRIKTGLIHSIVIGSFIFAHLTFMYINFGAIHPTSSLAIKKFLSLNASSNFLEAISPASHILTERLYQILTKLRLDMSMSEGARYIGLLVPITFSVTFLVIVMNKKINFKAPIIMIGIMAIIQFLYYVIFSNGWMRQWYFNGWFIIFMIGTCIITSQSLSLIHRFKYKLFFKLTFIFVPILIFSFLKINSYGCYNVSGNKKFCLSWKYFSDQSQILLDYKSNGYKLVGWTPDRATFFSGVGIIHLEGLVNNYDYVNNYLPGKIDEYLKEIKATHFIISNKPKLETKIRCMVSIIENFDKNEYVYGVLNERNSYIAIYEIIFQNVKTDKHILDELC